MHTITSNDIFSSISCEPAGIPEGTELVMLEGGAWSPIAGETANRVVGEEPHTYTARTIAVGFDLAGYDGFRPTICKVMPFRKEDFINFALSLFAPFKDANGQPQFSATDALGHWFALVDAMGGAWMLEIDQQFYDAAAQAYRWGYSGVLQNLAAADSSLDQFGEWLFGKSRQPISESEFLAYQASLPVELINPRAALVMHQVLLLLTPGILLRRLNARICGPEFLNVEG